MNIAANETSRSGAAGCSKRVSGVLRTWRSPPCRGYVLPGDISASDRYYHRDITHERFVLNDDSTITVPDKPGLGVTIDEEALKQFTLSELTLKPE
jgi:hypothetical protein